MRRLVLVLLVSVVLAASGVAAGGQPPLADAGLDQEVQQDQSVIIDGTGSRAPDGSIAQYAWRIESPTGATFTPACADCARSHFDASKVGTYTVTLTVTDQDGATSSDHLYVTVQPASNDRAHGRRGGAGSSRDGSSVAGSGSRTPSGNPTAGSTGEPASTPEPLPPDSGGSFNFQRPASIPSQTPTESSGDLVIHTYPHVSPFGTAFGGVSHFNHPNGETDTSSYWVFEIWD